MSETLKGFLQLDDFHWNVAMVTLSETEATGDAMMILLKRCDAETLAKILGRLPAGEREAVAAQLETVPVPDDKQIDEAEKTLAEFATTIPERAKAMREGQAVLDAKIIENRELLKSRFGDSKNGFSDQMREVPRPQKRDPEPGARIVELPPITADTAHAVIGKNDMFRCIGERKSRRVYTPSALSLAELSWLLWATQGKTREFPRHGIFARTVPSAGCIHSFETYVAALRVDSLEPGVYRYLADTHRLVFHSIPSGNDAGLPEKLTDAALGQDFVGAAAATFIWTTVPYRMEWRYVDDSAKLILLDAGHLCQNLYLAAEAIGCGTVGIGAYDQPALDALLGVAGKDELAVYLAPVGHVAGE